jgi:hypothetical protein
MSKTQDPEALLVALHLAAPNDTSGNPRRGWVLVETTGTVVGWIEEAYQGERALTSAVQTRGRALLRIPRVNVTVTELRRWRRLGAGRTFDMSPKTVYMVERTSGMSPRTVYAVEHTSQEDPTGRE